MVTLESIDMSGILKFSSISSNYSGGKRWPRTEVGQETTMGRVALIASRIDSVHLKLLNYHKKYRKFKEKIKTFHYKKWKLLTVTFFIDL